MSEYDDLLNLPVGTPVYYWPGARQGPGTRSVTRSTPWTLPAGDAVVLVDGYAGGIALTHVWPDVAALLAERDRWRQEEGERRTVMRHYIKRAESAEAEVATLRATIERVALAEVAAERSRQDEKWGEQNHPNGTGPDLRIGFDAAYLRHHGISAADLSGWAKERTDRLARVGRCTYEAILTEEWADAIAESDPVKLRAELIQVAAVAVAWVEKIDRDVALSPERPEGVQQAEEGGA